MDQFSQVPDQSTFDKYRVLNYGSATAFRATLYDSILYPTAGVNLLSFFQQPIGQGVTSAPGAVVGSAKTVHDTNMTLAGVLSAGSRFLADAMEFIILPGLSAAANTFTQGLPSVFAAVSAAAVAGQLNDVKTLLYSGEVEVNVLDKNITREINLATFPQISQMGMDVAVASNSATTAETAIVNGYGKGEPYMFTPQFTLDPSTSFAVNVNYPGLVATPTGFNARIICRLHGWMMRATA